MLSNSKNYYELMKFVLLRIMIALKDFAVNPLFN